jgi:hypothetical protein
MNNYTGLEYKVFKRSIEVTANEVADENEFGEDGEFGFMLGSYGYLYVLDLNDNKIYPLDVDIYEVRFLCSSKGRE